MKISVEFRGDESCVILSAQEDAEKHILGLIYTHQQLVEVVREYAEDAFVRKFDSSPCKLKLVLKQPPPQEVGA